MENRKVKKEPTPDMEQAYENWIRTHARLDPMFKELERQAFMAGMWSERQKTSSE